MGMSSRLKGVFRISIAMFHGMISNVTSLYILVANQQIGT